jgi:hypothetical protein
VPGNQQVSVRINIKENDSMAIKSFITMPEPVIRFSKVNLPGSSILDKSNLNSHFVNYWQILNKRTNFTRVQVDNLDKEIFTDDFDERHFGNNIKQYVLGLTKDAQQDVSKSDIYKQFTNMIIPKTKILFQLMKKYINNKLSIVEVVSYLEPFLIYTDDITYMQYVEITKYISQRITEYNKKYIDKLRLFKDIISIKSKSPIASRAFTIIDLLNKKYHNDILYESYNVRPEDKTYTNSELLQQLIKKDNMRLYGTSIALQNAPLMLPTEFSSLFEQDTNDLKEKLRVEDEKCRSVIISKYYTSIDALNADNGIEIYFDKKYDKTNYGIMEDNSGYAKEVLTKSPEELRDHIVADLLKKNRGSPEEAAYLAETLITGAKLVKDGHFAMLYKGYDVDHSNEIDYYIRQNNQWVIDNTLSEKDITTDDPSLLCNLQQECMTDSNDQCTAIENENVSVQAKVLKNVISEFDNKYKLSKQEFDQMVTEKYTYLRSIMPVLNRIETNQMMKYNNAKYTISISIDDSVDSASIKSPYEHLMNTILNQEDFVKIQTDIIRFCDIATRSAVDGFGPLGEPENTHWLYCNKTNARLIPQFKLTLASAFVEKGSEEYQRVLEIVKKEIGTVNDDGDWWCDKNSGWPICLTDFDTDEGYDDNGFRAASRSTMEEDAGDKMSSMLTNLATKSAVKFQTEDTRAINNIINTIAIAMGINIETQKEFIMNNVLKAIKTNVMPEDKYKEKARERAEKGKEMGTYKDFRNTALLYYSLGMILIAIQTSVPSIRTRKTHPGCIRSFSGFPFEGATDKSGIQYLSCIIFDIKDSGEPWNVLKRVKQTKIMTQLEEFIKGLLVFPDVDQKIKAKMEYLLTAPPSEIPEEHDVANWLLFLPPLKKFAITRLSNVSKQFEEKLFSNLRTHSKDQREGILVLQSKMIYFSLAIVEKIQEIVKKEDVFLLTSNNEPYLENACCQGEVNETTLQYFIRKAGSIAEYNEIISNTNKFLDDINSYSKSGMFYSIENTKNIYGEISNIFDEKIRFLSFIHFCKFKTLQPIPQEILPLCNEKPDDGIINGSDSLERIIQKLKENGINFNNEQLTELLRIVASQNIIDMKIETTSISSTARLIELLESVDEENDEVVEKSLRDLLTASLSTDEFFTEEMREEVRNLDNYLLRNIKDMKKDMIEFIQRNATKKLTTKKVKECIAAIKSLSEWSNIDSLRNIDSKISDEKVYNITNFYKKFSIDFVKLFPSIILNQVNYGELNIPKYYGFSMTHVGNLKKHVANYYGDLKKFYNVKLLKNILLTIQNTAKNIVLLTENTPIFTSVNLQDSIMNPIINEKTGMYLFEYYLLRILIEYVDLADNPDMLTSKIKKRKAPTMLDEDLVTREHLEDLDTQSDLGFVSAKQRDIMRGSQSQLKELVAEMLVSFIDIMTEHKNTINISYEDIQDRIFKLKEREKHRITDALKRMTDEQRNADTMLKKNKLGQYSIGLQKGLTMLDKEFYDREQEFRDDMNETEEAFKRKFPSINDRDGIGLQDFLDEMGISKTVEKETNNMSYLTEDYYSGQTDGFGAPELEYEDYEQDDS